MRVTGGLSQTFGWLVGTGPGAGMGLIILFCGFAAALVGLLGYFVPAIHEAEALLPDHDQLAKAEPNADSNALPA
jgi:hypothetical protein